MYKRLLFLLSTVACIQTKQEQLIAGFKKKDVQELLLLCGYTCEDTADAVGITAKEKWLVALDAHVGMRCEQQREQFLRIFKRMWLVDEWINQKFGYKYVLLMPTDMIFRLPESLVFVQKIIKAKITYDQWIFFAIDRPLTHEEKEFAKQQGWPDTFIVEGQLYEYVVQKQNISAELLKRCVVRGGYGAWNAYSAPTVVSMITTWYQSAVHQSSGQVLVISQQPYCYYHQCLLESILPIDFKIRVVGAAAGCDTPIVTYLTVIAQLIDLSDKKNQIVLSK